MDREERRSLRERSEEREYRRSVRRERRRNDGPEPEETEEIPARGTRKYRKKENRGFTPLTVFVIVLLTAAVVGIVVYVVAYRKVEEEFKYTRQPIVIEEGEAMAAIKENLENGSGMTTALRKGFKDYLVVYNDSKYIFLPINFNRKMHNRKSENVKKLPSGEWQYRENGRTVSYKGIDVSAHQGDIDWAKVKEDAVEFAMIRAVYRGYGEEGRLVTDKKFEENITAAAEAGIHVGVYMFSQALNEKELDEEVELLLSSIEGRNVTCPVVLDVELTEGGTGRADQLTMEERTALAKRFCEKVRAAGYRPMLYYNYETALLLLDTDQLEEYDVWYASYTSDFYYPYYYSLWQYTNTGKVSGIEGDVDLDMSFEKFW